MSLKKFSISTLSGFVLHVIIAVSIFLILCLVYFYAYLPNTTNHGESITVPNIEGMPMEKVTKFLTDHDLRYEVNDSAYSSLYPPLTVLKQFPAAGARVKEGRKIYVSINRINPPTVPMPDLIDGSLINADAVLRGNELKRGRIEFVSGPWLNLVKEMKTEGMTIAPGARIPKGSVIDLVVMDGGSSTFPTPNLKNLPLDEAEFVLKGTNLSVGKIDLLGDTTGLSPVIIKQEPQANTMIRVGEVVNVWIGAPGTEIPEEEDTTQDDLDDQTE